MRASILTFIACLITVPAQAQYGGGSGTKGDPYQIWTAGQLNAIGAKSDDWDKHFVLMADIDLKGLRGTPFNMIGVHASYGRPFSGVFNGNGKTIANFTCSQVGGTSFGLFAAVQGTDALIKNLRVQGAVVTAGTAGIAGALVGYLHSGTISRCHAEGGSVSGGFAVGGLVGIGNGTVLYCSSSASISTSDMSGGGLVGQNGGVVTKCASTGPVSARSWAGGLVGENSGTVSDSYSTAKATAAKGYAGGLVASNAGKIRNCYSAGAVSAPQGAGGLVGGTKGQQGVTDSFWDTQTSGQSTSAGGSGQKTAQMKTARTFSGWDFAGTWTIQAGVDYPRLQWEADPFPTPAPTTIEKVSGDGQSALAGHNLASPLTVCVKDQDDTALAGIQVGFAATQGGGTVEPASAVTDANGLASAKLTLGSTPGMNAVEAVAGSLSASFEAEGLARGYGGGTGAWDDPYLIYTAGQLGVLGTEPNDWDKCFKLMADVDLSGAVYDRALIGSDANTAKGGFQGTTFTGVFDGSGHKIAHLTIKGGEYLGLFGYVGDGGEVKNLGVTDAAVTGSGTNIGCLVGINSGIVLRCYSTGSVTGTGMIAGNVGGLVGNNSGYSGYGYVTECYSTAAVNGGVWVGGLVGGNSYGYVTDCYSTGSVIASFADVGGLVGSNLVGHLTRCYSTGSVKGMLSVGGLNGSNVEATVTGCFWDTQTSGRITSSGGTGRTTVQMKTAATFLNAGWDFVGETANGPEDIWWIDEGKDYPRLWWEAATK
jgi:hypothetical protein